MATLKIAASMVLGACVFMAAMNVYVVAGAAHGITIGVMGVVALMVMNLRT